MEPEILYEDDFIVVINKPAGMIVNTADTTKGERTVQEWIGERILRYKDTKIVRENYEKSPNILISQYPSISDFINRGGIVHRLDKETSGALIIAKTPESFENIQKQFKERTVKKTYQALVHGGVKPESGEINVPIGRLPWNRKRFGVLPEGRESTTSYKTLATYSSPIANETLSFLELYPKTGRTHQIRVHLKYIGHPIVSDELYAGRKTARNDRKFLPRLFLHAHKISFQHPSTGVLLQFDANLAEELQNVLKTLSKQSS